METSKAQEKQPMEIWREMEATKYSDAEIRQQIEYNLDKTPEYIQAAAQTAQAMIAYNRMIDDRITWAKNSWRR